jgi:hypothetical protein
VTALPADDVWRISHHHWSGKPHLNDRVLSLALAAALLIELYDGDFVRFTDDDDAVVVQHPRPWQADILGRHILARIEDEAFPLPTRTWLAYLATDARDQVARRMLRSGFVVRGRAVFWRPRRYLPRDLNSFGMAEAVLSQRLRKGEPLGYREQCLAALAQATGLEAVTLKDAPPAVFAAARFWAGQLPPELLHLMGHVQTAVATAVFSQTT